MTDDPSRGGAPDGTPDGRREPASEIWTPEDAGTPDSWPPTETWSPESTEPAPRAPESELWTPTAFPAASAAAHAPDAWRRSWEPVPAVEEAPFLGPPVPSPYAGMPTGAGRIVAAAFDLLAQANADLRRASFYVGLIVLGTVSPLALLTWRVIVGAEGLGPLFDPSAPAAVDPAVVTAFYLAALVGIGGFVVASVESRAVAIATLASRLAGRQLELRDAVQRSRTVFWRLLGATVLAAIPLTVVQAVLQGLLGNVFGPDSEGAVLSSTLVATVLFAPLAYVQAGVVIGDVGPIESLRRSIRLFRARRAVAIVIALFEFGSQFITVFGLLAGLDLIGRAVQATGFGLSNDATGAAVTVALIVILLFALGTLILTVAAIAVAPQVVAFVALTHASPGLDRIGGGTGRFRWLPRPMLAGMICAVVGLVLGIGSLG